MPNEKYKIELCKEEANLIYLCRKVKFGEINITLHNGKPHICKKSFENIRLDYLKDFDKELDKVFFFK